MLQTFFYLSFGGSYEKARVYDRGADGGGNHHGHPGIRGGAEGGGGCG